VNLTQLLAEPRHVLLDFDGPVCAVFPGNGSRLAADAVRRALGAGEWRKLPDPVSYSDDPFDVLRYASAKLDREQAENAEKALTAYEVESVGQVPPTEGALDGIADLDASGHTITLVSNNSEDAVSTFMAWHHLEAAIDGIAARTGVRRGASSPSGTVKTTV
jgi:beta-phosphoglucomutase-like phosphatase (HAD superfamily)